MEAQLKKGLLEACVLTALYREESYGYRIISDVSPYIAITESTLYPILRRLESSGCLTTHTAESNGRLRKYYRITEKGKTRMKEYATSIEELKKAYDFIIDTTKGDIYD